MGDSRKIIATAAMVTMATGVITSIAKGNGGLPSTRYLVGFGTAFFITSAMADLGAPRFAGALALIILVGTILENAPDVIDWTNQRTGATPKKKGK